MDGVTQQNAALVEQSAAAAAALQGQAAQLALVVSRFVLGPRPAASTPTPPGRAADTAEAAHARAARPAPQRPRRTHPPTVIGAGDAWRRF